MDDRGHCLYVWSLHWLNGIYKIRSKEAFWRRFDEKWKRISSVNFYLRFFYFWNYFYEEKSILSLNILKVNSSHKYCPIASNEENKANEKSTKVIRFTVLSALNIVWRIKYIILRESVAIQWQLIDLKAYGGNGKF